MKSLYRALLVWFIIALAGFLFADLVALPFFAGHFKATVIVPSVINLSPEQARNRLETSGLIYMVDSNAEFSPEVKAGLILKQRPAFRSKVKKGRRVWITVSKGLESVRLPQLKGGSLRQGEILLQQSGLKLGRVIKVRHKGFPSGVVFKTVPPAGSLVETGSTVKVFISFNKAKLSGKTVINMQGMSFSRAQAAVKAIGMTVGDIEFQHRSKALPKTVLRHSPAAGENIKPGEPIDFILSQ